MKKKRRKSYTAAFKVKIALEAIKGQRTINEIATHHIESGCISRSATKLRKRFTVSRLEKCACSDPPYSR